MPSDSATIKEKYRLVPIHGPGQQRPHSHYLLHTAGDRSFRVGHGFSEDASPQQLARMSRDLFESIALGGLRDAGRVVVPLSSRALIGKDGAGLVVDALREVDEKVRANLLIELHEFPEKLTLGAVEDAMIPLLLYVGGFIARMPDGLEDATVFANCNYIALSQDMAPEEGAETIRSIWRLAAPRRLKIFLWNLAPALHQDAQRMEVFGCTDPE